MRNIIYYVASSIDGFIDGPGGDISMFVGEGNGLEKYLADLQLFDTVIMGRNTYEFGYRFGLQPGQPAYPHMKHYIFSDRLKFENAHENVQVVPRTLETIHSIRQAAGTDIYLCGGGRFAGWLLDNELIDYVKIKLNPIVLGGGTRLFGNTTKAVYLDLQDSERYDKGLQIMNFRVRY